MRVTRGENYISRAFTKKSCQGAFAFTTACEAPEPMFPALLYACQESRQLALKVFDFAFATSVDERTVVTRKRGSYDPPGDRVVISHAKLTSPGVPFQPACDIIYMPANAHPMGLVFEFAEPDELKTGNILKLAMTLATSHRIGWDLLLSCEDSLFAGLEELIITEEEDGYDNVTEPWAQEVEEAVDEQIKHHKRENPNVPLPTIKVMWKEELNTYATGFEEEPFNIWI